MTTLDKAISFALMYHGEQYRDNSGIPYITHLLAVLRKLTHMGVKDEDILIASVLHDLLEDTICTKDDIIDEFGEDIANIVEELTRPDDISGFEDKRKYLEEFSKDVSLEAIVIKCTDRLVNVEDYFYTDSKYALRYLQQADCVFSRLSNTLIASNNHYVARILNELTRIRVLLGLW